MGLVADGGHRDAELSAGRSPGRVVTLGVYAAGTAVLPFAAPHHHKTTVRQAGYAGFRLGCGCVGVDLEFGAHLGHLWAL